MSNNASSAFRMSSTGSLYKTLPDDETFYDPELEVYSPFLNNSINENDLGAGEPQTDYQKEVDGNVEGNVPLEEKKSSVYLIWGRFASKTNMHGCAYVFSSKLWYARALWILLLLAAVGGFLCHFYFLTDDFLSYPKITKVKIGFSNLPFPTISFCNSNAVRMSRLNITNEDIVKLVDDIRKNSIDQQLSRSEVKKRKKASFLNFQKMNLALQRENTGYFKGDAPSPTLSNNAKVEDTFKSLFLKMKRKKRLEVGHHLQDMLIGCSIEGHECEAESFKAFTDANFGNCFSLEFPDDYRVSKSGPRQGLTIILYLETEEYLEGANQGYGIRLVVHERKTYPFPSDHGIFLPTGYETHIGLKMTTISRIGQPHGNCLIGDRFMQRYGVKYTKPICQSQCRQNNIRKSCGCHDVWDEDILHALGKLDLTSACRSQLEYECIKRVDRTYKKKCTCQDPCSEDVFRMYPSYRKWPTDHNLMVLRKEICENLSPDTCNRVEEQKKNRNLSQNVLKFTIYHEDLNYDEIKEEEEIGSAQYWSNVGGAIGLWVGLSLISLFEFLQFFCELIRHWYRVGLKKCQKKKEPRQDETMKLGKEKEAIEKKESKEKKKYKKERKEKEQKKDENERKEKENKDDQDQTQNSRWSRYNVNKAYRHDMEGGFQHFHVPAYYSQRQNRWYYDN